MLPQYKTVMNYETFPIDPRISTLVGVDSKTGKLKKVRALHRLTVTAFCRGATRYYVMFENEESGQQWIEEFISDPTGAYFEKIESDAEWEDIKAYMSYHLAGGNQTNPKLLDALGKPIKDTMDIGEDAIKKTVVQAPEMIRYSPNEGDLTPNERDEAEGKKRD